MLHRLSFEAYIIRVEEDRDIVCNLKKGTTEIVEFNIILILSFRYLSHCVHAIPFHPMLLEEIPPTPKSILHLRNCNLVTPFRINLIPANIEGRDPGVSSVRVLGVDGASKRNTVLGCNRQIAGWVPSTSMPVEEEGSPTTKWRGEEVPNPRFQITSTATRNPFQDTKRRSLAYPVAFSYKPRAPSVIFSFVSRLSVYPAFFSMKSRPIVSRLPVSYTSDITSHEYTQTRRNKTYPYHHNPLCQRYCWCFHPDHLVVVVAAAGPGCYCCYCRQSTARLS